MQVKMTKFTYQSLFHRCLIPSRCCSQRKVIKSRKGTVYARVGNVATISQCSFDMFFLLYIQTRITFNEWHTKHAERCRNSTSYNATWRELAANMADARLTCAHMPTTRHRNVTLAILEGNQISWSVKKAVRTRKSVCCNNCSIFACCFLNFFTGRNHF